MTYANTLTVTINAVAYVLQRRNQDNYGSVYKFNDATRRIEMLVRHTTDSEKGIPFNRHNVTLTHIIYATPTAFEQKYTCTVTLRERDQNDPNVLLQTWQGFNTLLLTMDDTLVVGDN